MLLGFQAICENEDWILQIQNMAGDKVLWTEDGLPEPEDVDEKQKIILSEINQALNMLFLQHAKNLESAPDPTKHTEGKADLSDTLTLYITDIAQIGGVSCGADGCWLVEDKAAVWLFDTVVWAGRE